MRETGTTTAGRAAAQAAAGIQMIELALETPAAQWLVDLDRRIIDAMIRDAEAEDAADRALDGDGECGAAAVEQGASDAPRRLAIEAQQLRELCEWQFELPSHEIASLGTMWDYADDFKPGAPCGCGAYLEGIPTCRRIVEFVAHGVHFRLSCSDARDLAAFCGVKDADGDSLAAAVAATFDAADVQAVAFGVRS